MATLKDHQQAMVDLLASGSGIPASASRLAHAMHDVLTILQLQSAARMTNRLLSDESNYGLNNLLLKAGATTPGLNDKALAADVEACRPKDTMFDRARAAERRVKELENTVKQLKESSAELKTAKQAAEGTVYELEGKLKETEQFWRKYEWAYIDTTALLKNEQAAIRELQERVEKLKTEQAYWYGRCLDAGILDESQEQAGCRKDDTQVCEHSWNRTDLVGVKECLICGATELRK